MKALTPKRLRATLLLLFVVLSGLAGLLIWQAQQQMQWETRYHYQQLAAEFAQRIEQQWQQWIRREESLSHADYSFLVLSGDAATPYWQRSRLSGLPDESAIPGLLGYFQVLHDGRFSTPLLPESPTTALDWGVTPEQLTQREDLQESLLAILARNQLVEQRSTIAEPSSAERQRALPEAEAIVAQRASPSAADDVYYDEDSAENDTQNNAESYVAQSGFDQLKSQSISKRAEPTRPAPATRKETGVAAGNVASDTYSGSRKTRREQSLMLDEAIPPAPQPLREASPTATISMFESEVDPFEVALLSSGHLVMFRKVWKQDRRLIQGAIIDTQRFLQASVGTPFQPTTLATMSDLSVRYGTDTIATYSAPASRYVSAQPAPTHNDDLYQARMSAPWNHLQLHWRITQLPLGPGAQLITWAGSAFFVVLIGGFWLLYRAGMQQIRIHQQRQTFVSAVSHELKTPLTAIRMYSEMLLAGWADEAKRQDYYRFIHEESERLSRLIANVLTLARVERAALQLDCRPAEVDRWVALVKDKLQSHADNANFTLQFSVASGSEHQLLALDEDAMIQIMLNLLDNAIKFCRAEDTRRLDISISPVANNSLEWQIRDYGPGIASGQLNRIFDLFYRPGNELTREATGTGIGLALVKQLTEAMQGQVSATNANPGATILLRFPLVAI